MDSQRAELTQFIERSDDDFDVFPEDMPFGTIGRKSMEYSQRIRRG